MVEEIIRSKLCHFINRSAKANDKYVNVMKKMKNCHSLNS